MKSIQAPCVVLLGGPSGVGKTTLARRLAHRLRLDLTQLDDLFITAMQLTSPAAQPALHALRVQLNENALRADPKVDALPAAEIVTRFVAVCAAFAPAVEAVVGDHLAGGTPVLLEGDQLLPATVARLRERHRGPVSLHALFLVEPDERRILANYAEREPDAGAQAHRARVSVLHGEWLQAECTRLEIPVLTASPRRTLFRRALGVVQA